MLETLGYSMAAKSDFGEVRDGGRWDRSYKKGFMAESLIPCSIL